MTCPLPGVPCLFIIFARWLRRGNGLYALLTFFSILWLVRIEHCPKFLDDLPLWAWLLDLPSYYG